MSKETLEEVTHQRNLLMQAIVDAAVRAGIIKEGVSIDGPTCLMLLDDMAYLIVELDKLTTERF